MNIFGNGNINVSGGGHYRVFHVLPNVSASIMSLSITDGYVNNDVGGGIDNSGTLYLEGDTINGNWAAGSTLGSGGGIYNSTGATLTVASCNIGSNHAAGVGGGIANAGVLTIESSRLSGNQASVAGGGLYNAFDNGPQAKITGGTTFSYNSAPNGGGIYNSGGNAILSGGTISNNHSQKGGGIYNWAGTLTLNGTYIGPGNQASIGGGMYLGSTSATFFKNVTVNGNTASSTAPGVAWEEGATLWDDETELTDNDDPGGQPVEIVFV